MKTALILSGGGLFGAWQVGAWSVLRQKIRFDVIVGASIGSLNGWAIAGGASPEELEAKWLDAVNRGRNRFQLPLRRPLDGIVEFAQIEGFIRDIHDSYRPELEYYAVLTELVRLKSLMVSADQMNWRHLAASCALLGLLPQQRINRILYTDGGFLDGAMPLWAAGHCQATHVLGLNVMPKMPWPVRAVLKPLRGIRGRPLRPPKENTVVLAPSRVLGDWKAGFLFQRAKVPEWIELGRADAERALRDKNISFADCFEA